MAVEVGKQAPDFTLNNQDGNAVSLADFHGKRNVVLVFYFTAFSGICAKELQELQGAAAEVAQKDAQVLLISCDSRWTLNAFKQREGFAQTLLSDWWPHGAVAKQYGVFDENLGGAKRATFVVDRQGVVLYKKVNEIPQGRNVEDYLQALATCPLPGLWT